MSDQVVSALDALMWRWSVNPGFAGIVLPDDYREWPSPCLVGHEGGWRPWRREMAGSMTNLATALEMELHPALSTFYCHWFSASLPCCFKGLYLALIQPWNEEDFARLQENLIGHLLMQKKLRLPESLFLASTRSERHIISLDNRSGAICYELLGSKERTLLAPSLDSFLGRLELWPAGQKVEMRI